MSKVEASLRRVVGGYHDKDSKYVGPRKVRMWRIKDTSLTS
jgi:hypothetical protein